MRRKGEIEEVETEQEQGVAGNRSGGRKMTGKYIKGEGQDHRGSR